MWTLSIPPASRSPRPEECSCDPIPAASPRGRPGIAASAPSLTEKAKELPAPGEEPPALRTVDYPNQLPGDVVWAKVKSPVEALHAVEDPLDGKVGVAHHDLLEPRHADQRPPSFR